MSHKLNCLGYVCTCRGSALRTFCPGCESVPVKDPSKELCKDCDVKAKQHRKDMGVSETEKELSV